MGCGASTSPPPVRARGLEESAPLLGLEEGSTALVVTLVRVKLLVDDDRLSQGDP